MGHATMAGVHKGVVAFLSFGWWDVADRLQQPSVVEPVDPFQRGELDGFKRPPGSAPVDELSLVEAVDGLGESVVVAVADAAHGRLHAGLGQAPGTGGGHDPADEVVPCRRWWF